MSEKTDRLGNLLKQLGLTEEEVQLYRYMVVNGPSTALKLSRGVGIARTKVYRLLDTLYEKRLVNQRVEGRGLKFETESFGNLEMLVKDKENELNSLKNNLPLIYQELNGLSGKSINGSKILFYDGVEGLKQVTWNSLKAKDGLDIFEIKEMGSFLDFEFSETVRKEFVERKIFTRQISNLKKLDSWTNVTQYVKKYWKCKYIDPKILETKFEILIYNDVVCLYNYKNDKIFCVEIYDQRLAEMQRQMFNFVWNSAKEMKLVNENGEVKLQKYSN